MERGRGERLKLVAHDETWDVHRSVLRERGIVMLGPPAHTLIDPVSPEQLRSVMRSLLSGWAARILADPDQIKARGYQSYVVLSLCRILYTLQHGTIVAKPVAAAWARENLDSSWHGLIERAWEGRSQPGLEADPGDLAQTLELIRYTSGRAGQTQSLPG
jgi:hypothetical protein